MQLRDYQKRAVQFVSVHRICAVVSPAGSGKTIIAAASLAEVTARKHRIEKVKVGWMANTLEQCQQAESAIKLFPILKKFCDVKIACAAANTDWSDRDVLVVDESHHGIAQQWHSQIKTCHGAIWGFTATPPEDSVQRFQWETLFGNQILKIERNEVDNNLVPAIVRLLPDTDESIKDQINFEIDVEYARRLRWWGGDPQKLWGMVAWQICIDRGIVLNQKRNSAAIRMAIQHREDSVLLLVNKIEHGEMFLQQIPRSVLCFSKMGAKKRREAIAAFRSGEIKCLVATSLADEGLDVPIANVLILVSGGRSSARTEQRTGRVLRLHESKQQAIIYDFEDTWHPLAAKHSRRRVEIYKSLGYEIPPSGRRPLP